MLENVQRAMNRIEQIEDRLSQSGPPQDSGAFQHLFRQAAGEPFPAGAQALSSPPLPASLTLNQIGGVNPQLWSLMRQGGGCDPSMFGPSRAGAIDVVPLAQNNSVSCGQTSVAMAVNALTEKNLRDYDINSRYGFELLNALNAESASAGFRWRDGGELHPGAWELIDHKVNRELTPVVVALNGPEFSASGRGHIVTILRTEGDRVVYADPADGQVKTTTRQAMESAPPHPDGNFIFYATREVSGGPFLANR